MQSLGHDVRTYDNAFDTGYLFEDAIRDRDLIFIAVPTPHDKEYDGSKPIAHLDPKDFDYSALEQVVNNCQIYQPDTPIVIISTVLPGTIRRLFSKYGDKIIYNPYLIGMGSVKEDLIDPDIIIIGTATGEKNNTTQSLMSLYSEMYLLSEQNRVCHVTIGTWEEAESIKIFYNTFISTKLALVNMIQDVAMKTGNMNVDVVTKALQHSTKRITSPTYMTAGMGDGGPCHPRDNIALQWFADELGLGYNLFRSIVHVREMQASNMALFLIKQANENNLPIYIHGKSFKPNVPYTDGSYSLLVGSYIEQLSGKRPIYIDPLTDIVPTGIRGVILLAHNSSVTYNYYSRNTNNLYCNFISGSIIVDPWRTYTSKDESIKVIHYGNTRGSFTQ